MAERAIGIFDSGVGGLTVYREIARQLPDEDYLYLGDTGRVPYGTKSPETVLRYAREATAFLVGLQVKMIVVACNTASAVALADLEERFRLPVVGVIEPGARKAVAVTRNHKIGIIGTEGTIKSGAYSRAVHALDAQIQVFTAPCPLFVPLVEEGWIDHPVTRLVAEEYLAPLLAEGIDTLVLGCTHYPLLKPTLHALLGDSVTLVDSAAETAKSVREILHRDDLIRQTPPAPSRFFVTDLPNRFERVGGSFLGDLLTNVQQVEIG